MILTPDYLRGFYDGVTHKDTPAADACRQVERTFYTATGSAIEAAKELRRYCRERGPYCKDCPFSVSGTGTICALRDDLPEDWKIMKEGEPGGISK